MPSLRTALAAHNTVTAEGKPSTFSLVAATTFVCLRVAAIISPLFFCCCALALCKPGVFGNEGQEMFHQVLLINASPHAGFNGESLNAAQEPLSRRSKQHYFGHI